jgi:hypothetical protein
MSMVTFTTSGDLSKTKKFLNKMKSLLFNDVFDEIGLEGVLALSSNTPKNTGRLSSSWEYKVERDSNGATITWYNTDIEGGYNVAVLVQYGHGLKGGGYVSGVDFINPALRPVFDEFGRRIEEEIKRS